MPIRHFNSVATRLALLLCVGIATHHSPLFGEEKPLFKTLVVDPQGESVPALKHSLLPPMLDLKPGNAAPIYLRSTYEQGEAFRKELRRASEWLDKPLEEFKSEEVRQYVRQFDTVFKFFDRGARRESCDWEYPLGEEPAIYILLPDAQSMRAMARLLAVKARLEIVEGRFDDAIHTLQTGYALGQHVAETPFLVCELIGMAISNIMSHHVEELIQQENAPNMYWALTKLPRPLFNLRDAIETEANFLELTFPVFKNLDKPQSVESIQQDFEAVVDLFAMESMRKTPGSVRPTMLGMTLAGYPKARRYLIDVRGMSEEAVDRLPVIQVVLLYSRDIYNIIRDEQFKWFYVPYNQEAIAGYQRAEKFLSEDARAMEILPLAQTLLPAIRASHQAQFRVQRKIEALQVVEAVRMHAAANGGKLPTSLNDITIVPIPIDSVTRRPFTYQLQGDHALLTAAAPKGRDEAVYGIHYKIVLRNTK